MHVCVCMSLSLVPEPPQRLAAAVGQWVGSFFQCSSAPSPPVQMWSSASGPRAPPASALQTPSSKEAMMLVQWMKDADQRLKKLQCCAGFIWPCLTGLWLTTGLHISDPEMPNVWKKSTLALKPSASEDKKLRSIHLATVQMAGTQTHAWCSKFKEHRDRRTRTLLSVYDGRIMCKLGLNKAPVG